ncbi:MAG TPA: hypothetical protein VKP60_04550 [Magnetospirillaceae bacterium]|nr:hypothetical protein [Magnetospirillaceae bacterium]
MLKVAASVALLFSLAACSGPPKPGTPEYALQQHEFQAEKVKTAADQAPDWYMNPPKGEGFVYATGTATSTDLQFAVDKAVLNAKYQLADQMAGKVSGKQKDFITETADGRHSGTAERATSNVVADIALPAYQVVQRKVVPVDTQFRSYVLLQFASARTDMPAQQQASAGPSPSAVSVQKQAEAAHRELQSDIASAKEDAAALTPTAPRAVVAFPIGMPPPASAAAPIAQTAEVPATAADPESPGVLVHPETPHAPLPAEPPLPAAAPIPAVEGNRL